MAPAWSWWPLSTSFAHRPCKGHCRASHQAQISRVKPLTSYSFDRQQQEGRDAEKCPSTSCQMEFNSDEAGGGSVEPRCCYRDFLTRGNTSVHPSHCEKPLQAPCRMHHDVQGCQSRAEEHTRGRTAEDGDAAALYSGTTFQSCTQPSEALGGVGRGEGEGVLCQKGTHWQQHSSFWVVVCPSHSSRMHHLPLPPVPGLQCSREGSSWMTSPQHAALLPASILLSATRTCPRDLGQRQILTAGVGWG